MTTIVTHIEKGGRYAVLGAGHGMFKTSRPSVVLGSLLPSESEGRESVLALCDSKGAIAFGHSKEFRVVSIDGQSPKSVLDGG